MIYTKEITFFSDGRKLAGTLYAPSKGSVTPAVLFIHGAGKANRTRYFPWQEYLAKKGFSSFSFDVRGVGESEGNFEEGSLNNRLIDAQNALKTFIKTGFVDPRRLGIGGNSMGAHVAVRLIEKNPEIKAIMLGCAAAYGIEAEGKQLNEEFTWVIRKPDSWKTSPVFPILNSYKGKVFILYGEEEEVIPHEVEKNFLDIAKTKGEAYLLPHIGHKLLQPENEQQKQAVEKLFTLSSAFLEKYL